MSITLGGTNPAVTFPDGTIQNTSANLTAPYTSNGVVYASSTTALSTGSGLVFDGTNLGIGTSSPSQKLEVATASGGTIGLRYIGNSGIATVGTDSNNNLLFSIGNPPSEKMRIFSNGNVGIGTASAYASVDIFVGTDTNGSTGQGGISIQGGSAGNTDTGHASGTSSGSTYYRFYYNASVIGSISQSGTTAVLYNVTSDQRLKENIVDAPEFGGIIDSLQVRSFDWKTDHTHQRAGFVAQELVTVAPEAVHQPINEEDMMAVDYSKLVPMLVKEIQSLRKRILTLENK
jgi:hypothetical protein